jgi:hypothetical protein
MKHGKSVIVIKEIIFAIANYNFIKCDLIPSVIMHAKILKSINESFYRSSIHVDLKNPIFELLNAINHTIEYNIVD